MTVLCVDEIHESLTCYGKKATMPPVYVGNYYNVVDKVEWRFMGKTWLLYELAEIKPNPGRCLYASDLFAECSDVDVSEFVTEKEEVYAR